MKDVFAKIALADDEFDEWLANIGLLHSRRTCPRCQGEMGRKNAQVGKRYGAWRCKSDLCGRKELGFLVGTFFQVKKQNSL